ncbi:MAG: GTP 3',8-cyclase MoaA [Desulfobacteraceae bacterium]|jgi:cyclic pyranopterin phosphate synthase|nr:GTP 3',8-cyclase MoaA [Desulfobacteraceae bacterium]
MALVDAFDRKIDYLRISITDHCNLNCKYCSPPFSGRTHLQRREILTFEEIAVLAEAAVAAGITRIRLTGGEPLIRNGVVDLCRMLTEISRLESLSLTTNGVRLGSLAGPLSIAGVHRINVSLDSLKPNRFAQITGQDRLTEVLAGIKAAEVAGLAPIKINTVVMRGVNDDEIADLAALTFDNPYHVRFIELMPFQHASCGDYDRLHVPVGEIIRKIPGIDCARVNPILDNPGPARLCALPGAKGKIGFIAPMSWHFCGSCNRLRLTADGKIRSCLFSNDEMDIKTPLRRGASKKELSEFFTSAAKHKPRRHHLNEERHSNTARGMYAIGG